MTSDYNVEIPGQLAPDSWFGVSGGALPYRIEVQVGLSAGRPVLLGLRVEEVGEVSARQLRTIRVPEIAKAVIAEVQAEIFNQQVSPEDLNWLREYRGPWETREGPTDAFELAWQAMNWDQLSTWLEAVQDADPGALLNRGRGAKAPTDADYEGFAKAYLEEHLAGQHGAKTRTAKRVGMDRVTVYRWAKVARERGLLPPEDEKGTQS